MQTTNPTPDPSPNSSTRQGFTTMLYTVFLALLCLHFYYFCYLAFAGWHATFDLATRFAINMAHAPIFRHRFSYKLVILGALSGIIWCHRPGNKTHQLRPTLRTLAIGLFFYFTSDLAFTIAGDPSTLATTYIVFTCTGLIFLYVACSRLIDRFRGHNADAVFNRASETFPQQERPMVNDYSLHFNARYHLQNQTRDSQISIINRFRGTLIVGNAGSGKTSHLIRPIIRQSLGQGMAMLVYDLKFDGLTRFTYNLYLKERNRYTIEPRFYTINFTDLSRSHRCNPLEPATLTDADDAREIARGVLVGLNPNWADQGGNFFVESAIGFLTANLWFLRRYRNGAFCTLPHLIEFCQADFAKLFSVLQSDKHVQTLIRPFVSAMENKTYRQLQAQVDSARIGLLTLASPNLYYLLSGGDFTLDLNNPRAPKIICLGSSPDKQGVYGHVVALYLSRLLKLVNRRGGWPCEICLDEFSSLPPVNLDITLAQARENRVSVTFGVQDLAQLSTIYGRTRAEAIFNLPGNIFCGQTSGDAARMVSERIGKIRQPRTTTSTSTSSTSHNQISGGFSSESTTHSTQLDYAVPTSTISQLSSGEFAGVIADTPDQPLALKAFHARLQVDFAAQQAEESTFVPLPEIHPVTPGAIDARFLQIKAEAAAIIDTRLAEMKSSRRQSNLIIPKKRNTNWRTTKR